MSITATVRTNLGDSIRELSQKVEALAVANVIAFGSAVLEDLIEQTPKLSGQATANWHVSLGQSNDVFIELDGPRAEYHSSDVDEALQYGLEVIESFEVGATLVIFNNAPYILQLNAGYSPKAPANFIEDIVEGHAGLLTNASAELS